MFFQPSRKIELKKCLLMSRTFITLRTSCGAVYCNQSCLCILSLNIAPGGNIFFTNAIRKKQLYRQEVPEQRSKIYTNKNFPGNLEFPGEFLPGCMSRRNTVCNAAAQKAMNKKLSWCWQRARRVCRSVEVNKHFGSIPSKIIKTRICAAEMAVRYAALSACRKVHPWR